MFIESGPSSFSWNRHLQRCPVCNGDSHFPFKYTYFITLLLTRYYLPLSKHYLDYNSFISTSKCCPMSI